MSQKISAFATLVPAPLTKRDFTFICSKLPQSCLLVQAASFPTESLGEVAVPVHGQRVYFPTLFQGGTWTFEVADSAFTTVRYELLRMYYSKQLFNVTLVPCCLSDALSTAISGLNPLNILKTIKSVFSFGGLTQDIVAAILSGVILNKCYILKVEDVQFSAGSDAVNAITWRVTLRFNYSTQLFQNLPLIGSLNFL